MTDELLRRTAQHLTAISETPIIGLEALQSSVNLVTRRVVGFTREAPAFLKPTVSIPTVWRRGELLSPTPPIAIISPGFGQTFELQDKHPFLQRFESALKNRGYLVIRYEDAGVHGSSDPAFAAYSLSQHAENLSTIVSVVQTQPWWKPDTSLLLAGFSSGCHSVLNYLDRGDRLHALKPNRVILVSPLLMYTSDIVRYLERTKTITRKPQTHVVSYMYQSPTHSAQIEYPANWQLESEERANINLTQAISSMEDIPTLVLCAREDKFNPGGASARQLARLKMRHPNLTVVAVDQANHDMVGDDKTNADVLSAVGRFLDNN